MNLDSVVGLGKPQKPFLLSPAKLEWEHTTTTRHRQRRRRHRPSTLLCYGTAVLLSSSFVVLLPATQSLSIPVVVPDHLRTSQLFSHQRLRHLPNQRRSRNTARFMVLTTPESIIEQASTQKLLDDLIDESVRTSARRPIMLQFDPSSGWIWRRWTGTVFSETWRSCVTNMLYAVIMLWIYRSNPGKIKEHLAGFNVLWGQLLQVTTFTLTFFVNQSYALWRKCSEMSRRLQGRLNDIGMFLAPHAARKTPSSPNEPSTYTPASRQLLELVSRYVRLFNLLTYASFTRSHRPILTPRGMRRLVERGLMTPLERQVLVSSAIPATQRHNAVLLWIVRAFIEGRQHGHLVGGAGFENEFLEKVHVTRASYGAIGDELQGRMPLAYAHLVQVLVDVILWTYPVMAYTSGISPVLVILGTGLLTMSYQGLFDLAKQFLDPYDNENYGKGEDPLCVDTLIAETNAGSIRWMNSFEEMPFSAQRIKDGELFEYLLPVRGYSVEELQLQEQEKLEKEQREREERVQKEEEERLKKEEEDEQARLVAEGQDLEAIALYTTEDIAAASGTVMNETSSLDVVPSESNQTELVSPSDSTVTDAPPSPPSEKAKAVHKVTSLESGMPVSFDPQQKTELKDALETQPGDAATMNLKSPDATSPTKPTEPVNGAQKESTKSQLVASDGLKVPVNGNHQVGDQLSDAVVGQEMVKEEVPWNSINLGPESLQDLPLFAEVGPDGLPIRDDKTKLDGISQLWGLPPDDSSDLLVRKETPTFDESQFDGISQLWGQTVPPLSLVPSDNTEVVGPDSFGEVSPLWGDTALDDAVTEQRPSRSLASGANLPGMEITKKAVTSSPWSDEALFDGKGRRLSEMLANETWNEQLAFNAAATSNDYNKRDADILEFTKDELLETEAILKAPPGACSVDVPEKEGGVSMKAANATVFATDTSVGAPEKDATQLESTSTSSPTLVAQEDLDALEMDAVVDASDKLAESTGETAVSKPVAGSGEMRNQTLAEDGSLKA